MTVVVLSKDIFLLCGKCSTNYKKDFWEENALCLVLQCSRSTQMYYRIHTIQLHKACIQTKGVTFVITFFLTDFVSNNKDANPPNMFWLKTHQIKTCGKKEQSILWLQFSGSSMWVCNISCLPITKVIAVLPSLYTSENCQRVEAAIRFGKRFRRHYYDFSIFHLVTLHHKPNHRKLQPRVW